MSQKKYAEAQKFIDNVLLRDSTNKGALWYGGMNNFQNTDADLRVAIRYFERLLPLIDEKQGQYFSASWFIGRSYQILLQNDGLNYDETSRMLDCYATYLRLQPNASDAQKIAVYVQHIKEIRPPNSVKKWISR